MKFLFSLFILFFCLHFVYSQDVITTIDGEKRTVHIMEVTGKYVVYNNVDDPDKLTFRLNLDNVETIDFDETNDVSFNNSLLNLDKKFRKFRYKYFVEDIQLKNFWGLENHILEKPAAYALFKKAQRRNKIGNVSLGVSAGSFIVTMGYVASDATDGLEDVIIAILGIALITTPTAMIGGGFKLGALKPKKECEELLGMDNSYSTISPLFQDEIVQAKIGFVPHGLGIQFKF